MRKNSAMGGGEFEYIPEKLEEKIYRRESFYEEKHNQLEKILNDFAMEYAKQSLGDSENFKRELLRMSVLELRGDK